MSSNNKIKKLSKEMFKPGLNLSKDYAEIGLDKVLNDDLLKEIPFIKTLVAIKKTGVAIKELFFIKKFLVFQSEFESNAVDEKILIKFRNDFEQDEKFRNKITEQIIVKIEELDSIKKAKILAYLFGAYLKKDVDWKRFVSLASCLKSLQEVTFDYLKILSKERFNFTINSGRRVTEIREMIAKHNINNQFSDNEMEALFMASGIGFRNGSLFQITKLGQDLYVHGISMVLNDDDY